MQVLVVNIKTTRNITPNVVDWYTMVYDVDDAYKGVVDAIISNDVPIPMVIQIIERLGEETWDCMDWRVGPHEFVIVNYEEVGKDSLP
jgi:hypothetical protein